MPTKKKVLIIAGSGFNFDSRQHFRVVFLPPKDQIVDAMNRVGDFLQSYDFA